MVRQTPPPESRRRKAAVGFEPTNTGVAHQRLGPLGYAADLQSVLLSFYGFLKLYCLCISAFCYFGIFSFENYTTSPDNVIRGSLVSVVRESGNIRSCLSPPKTNVLHV